MASLAVMCPELLWYLFGWRPGWAMSLLVQLAFIWIVTVVAFYPVCDSIIILNLSAAIKILLAVLVGVLGILYVARSGFVNDMAARTFLPSFDLERPPVRPACCNTRQNRRPSARAAPRRSSSPRTGRCCR